MSTQNQPTPPAAPALSMPTPDPTPAQPLTQSGAQGVPTPQLASARPGTGQKLPPRPLPWADLAILLALLLGAGATHGAVFGGYTGYAAAAGGATLGLLLGAIAGRWRWNLLETLLGLILIYLLCGGALALPATTTAHVIPTMATLQGLVVGSVKAWKDLLTLTPPASYFTGPGIVPYLASLLMALLATTIVVRTKRQGWALMPIAILAITGALWGSQYAPLAPWIGAAVTTGCVAWYAWLERRRRQSASSALVGERTGLPKAALARTLATAGTALAVAALIALVAAPALTRGAHRTVLRDEVPPPLELSSYASPLTSYHRWMTEQKDTVLFTVDGLTKGERVRLATLDTYDGVVMRVGDSADGEGFVRVGEKVTDQPLTSGQKTDTLRITIQDYTGYWLPGGGDLRSLTVTGKDSQPVANSLYYSQQLRTAMSSRGVRKGDSYTVTALRPPKFSEKELVGASTAPMSMPADTHVPEEAATRLSDLVTDDSTPVKALRTMTDSFVSQGFYSDGTQAPSLASHSAGRMSTFLDPDAIMVGDDEQYAVAMALVARQAGYPARVVLGFYPEQYAKGTQKITGADAHAWVEVAFAGLGWVTFDPTPPRDKIPQTQQPKPRPNPRPQVMQPPVPPQEPEDLDTDEEKQTHDEHEGHAAWVEILLAALKVAGGMGVIALPFVIIVAAKAVRRRRRRSAEAPMDRVTGAWDEVLDTARDLRVPIPDAASRAEQALAVSGGVDAILAAAAAKKERKAAPSSPDPSLPTPKRTIRVRLRSAVAGLGRKLRWRAAAKVPAPRPRPEFGAVPEPGTVAAVARSVDAAIFSGALVDAELASATWQDAEQTLAQLRRSVGRRRRWAAAVRPTSLRHSWSTRSRFRLRRPSIRRRRKHSPISSTSNPGGQS